MKDKRYTDEFKKEAVKQATERGYLVSEVAERLGTTTHSVYLWLKKFGETRPRQAEKDDLAYRVCAIEGRFEKNDRGA